MMSQVYDKTGREVRLGDIIKVYHYTAALRRKKHYMYKQVVKIAPISDAGKCIYLHMSHLDLTGHCYFEAIDGKHRPSWEIVQSVDAAFEDRPRTLPESGEGS